MIFIVYSVIEYLIVSEKNETFFILRKIVFIGTTAITLGFTLVSKNTKHLSRLENLKLENCVIR